MSARIRQHIRSNVYGLIAIFIALSGTAYAVDGPLPGQNQVGSDDIINGEVKAADIGVSAVENNEIAANAVAGGKVIDDSLTGADVNESTLSVWRLAGNANTNQATNFLGTTDNRPLNLRVNDARAFRLEPASNGAVQSPNVIGGINDNSVTSGVFAATISGGGRTDPTNPATANRVTDHFGTVGGGANNQAGNNVGGVDDRTFATVGGGRGNTASGIQAATVGGGDGNTASANKATVGGGNANTASGESATVGGGVLNAASGFAATVPGGVSNAAAGDFSFVAGRRAKNSALDAGVFLFADSTNADFGSAAADEFAARASGGFRFRTSGDLSTGCNLPAGSGTFDCTSDRHAKTGFDSVSPGEVLTQLSRLPIESWIYKTDPAQVRHIGPTAQAFKRAFGIGEDPRTISTVDADGVALAAIKGLNERVDALSGKAGPAPVAEAPGASLAPAAVAGIALLAAMLAAGLTAALALRWSGRAGGRLATG